ncbi:uncharacterized protein LOC111696315 [Eurytemora carolleeae]|uniref:uncharacterized protein LOC111696315 n=1 Tax=Eurytemora carolleeae TaxID=1294199 RepID=UPI000C7748D9|nr:uncharacterized protein LOC111696315 [Eurytemora carolleeae]|eukprot:XP_023321654.1 uncharacterized protein LOC111696315 [Eurytemora affinis]
MGIEEIKHGPTSIHMSGEQTIPSGSVVFIKQNTRKVSSPLPVRLQCQLLDNKPDLIQLKFKNREAPRSPDPNNPPDNPSIYFIKTPSPKLKTKFSLKKSISAPSNLKTIPENIMLQQPLNPTQPQPQPPMPPRVLQKRTDSEKIKKVPTVSKSNKIKKSKTENDLAYRTKYEQKKMEKKVKKNSLSIKIEQPIENPGPEILGIASLKIDESFQDTSPGTESTSLLSTDPPEERAVLRSYQKDLVDFYRNKMEIEKEGVSSTSVRSLPSESKTGQSRLGRRDKQAGWSLPRPKRRTSKVETALRLFIANLFRPTEQRNLPLPKKQKHNDAVPVQQVQPRPAGKMKVGLKMKGGGGRKCCKSGYCTRCFSQVDAYRNKSRDFR